MRPDNSFFTDCTPQMDDEAERACNAAADEIIRLAFDGDGRGLRAALRKFMFEAKRGRLQ